jgi:hypothetical protein
VQPVQVPVPQVIQPPNKDWLKDYGPLGAMVTFVGYLIYQTHRALLPLLVKKWEKEMELTDATIKSTGKVVEALDKIRMHCESTLVNTQTINGKADDIKEDLAKTIDKVEEIKQAVIEDKHESRRGRSR